MNPSYQCPVCSEWIEIPPRTNTEFFCPWCNAPVKLIYEGERKLVSNREHVERMIEHGHQLHLNVPGAQNEMKFKHP